MLHRTFPFRLALLSAAVLVPAGCRTGPATDSGAPEPGAAVFTVVFLRSGDASSDLGPERRAELADGQAAFMQAEAEAGRLLLTGPFGFDKAADDLRGIFVLDEADMARALEISKADPATQAGMFRQEALPLATLDVLRELPAMEQARQEGRAAAGADMSRPDLRPYVVLIAADGERAARVIGHPALAATVVLFGRLGPPRDGALFAVLALENSKEARARLAIANEAGVPFEISEWSATPTLLELTRDGPPGAGARR